MRLWHQKLIPYLPRQQLLGQHRECCALRGKGWSRKHATVDYVFTHDPSFLVAYHYCVMAEMKTRGYHPDPVWKNANWRGKELGMDMSEEWAAQDCVDELFSWVLLLKEIVYPEHNEEYLEECLDNLKSKGIEIEIKGE